MLTPNEVKAIKEWAGSSHEKRMQGILRDVLALVQTVEELRGLLEQATAFLDMLVIINPYKLLQLAATKEAIRAALGE